MASEMFAWEAILRGAATGMLLLGALRAYAPKTGFGVQNLGALFMLATIAYVLKSSPVYQEALTPVYGQLRIIATFYPVFFWWFATALFDDEFCWRWWRFVPAALVALMYLGEIYGPAAMQNRPLSDGHQVLVIAMSLHAIWLALANRRGDLLESRRRFRLWFAGFVGVMSISVAAFEILYAASQEPQIITALQAAAIFVLCLVFFIWLFPPIRFFVGAGPKPQGAAPDDLPAQDRLDFERIEKTMRAGLYTSEKFSIADLSAQVNLPAHRVRFILNQQLGFRNFAAYVNSYRIKDAAQILSDPENARLQITQIAFDLGYGSIAPFNRAFKSVHGKSPTEFRKQALAQYIQTRA